MLSIVVPAYNEGEHIYDNLMTIDKALKAFTSDYEIIAVNDGSKDNTGAEAARAAQDNPNIKDFGYEVNRGKGGAVSWGAVNSKGDIVGFIDADLDLSPDFIKMYFEKMNESGVVTRAKCPLIRMRKMTEEESNYYLEKKAMDEGSIKREIIQGIINLFT